MDPDEEIEIDFSPFLIMYKSGRVQRFGSTSRKSAGTDATTGVTSKDVIIDAGTGLAARLFLPRGVSGFRKLPVLVYFHGGSFVTESAFSPRYTSYVNALVAAARVVAVSVEHRLAPEHPLPAAYDDAWAALCWTAASCVSGGSEPWLADHGDSTRLFVAGSSSGGNVAHNLAMRAGKGGGARIELEGMVLLHPLFLGKALMPSEGTDPAFPEIAQRNWGFVCTGKFGIDHPFINPLAMPPEEWAALGCRRALVTTAELDHARDRGRKYVEALRGSSAWRGEEAALYETEGEEHLYYFLKGARSNSVVAAKAANEMAAVVSFIRRGTCASDCNIRSTM